MFQTEEWILFVFMYVKGKSVKWWFPNMLVENSHVEAYLVILSSGITKIIY